MIIVNKKNHTMDMQMKGMYLDVFIYLLSICA